MDDVTALLSKGWNQLSSVAGVAATTATTAVRSGTTNLNHMIQEKGVADTLQQTSKVVGEKGFALAQVCRLVMCAATYAHLALQLFAKCGNVDAIQLPPQSRALVRLHVWHVER